MNHVTVEDAISRVNEYNAAMELSYSGLAGLGALLANPPVRNLDLATEELRICVNICRTVEEAFSGNEEAARKHYILHAAFRRIFPNDPDRDAFRASLTESRSILEDALDAIPGGDFEKQLADRLREVNERLRQLSEKIKSEIPREAYLSSLAGTPHTLPNL